MTKRHGFSLIELSIVLVIIGLIIGGILLGQSLLKAAQLRSVGAEADRYGAAIRLFVDKYSAPPGDMSNATSFWGTDPGGCPGTALTSTTPRITTCDGNGDGQITLAAGTANEVFRSWQHLSAAGLVEGTFTGVTGTSLYSSASFNQNANPPNTPLSRYRPGLWSLQNLGSDIWPVSSTSYFEGVYNNVLYFGQSSSGAGAVLTPTEAWNVDKKIDDGMPGTGRMVIPETDGNPTTGCSDTSPSGSAEISLTSQYLLGNTSVACRLIFKDMAM